MRINTVLSFLALAFLSATPTIDNSVSGTRKEVDIPYTAGAGHKQQLDLFLPDSKNFATILFVHGGSLAEGDRKESPYPMIGEAFQKAGFGCAVMSYRLASDGNWPAQPRDVATAFAWVRKNIASRGGDPGKIFLVGHSSGALLVALVSSDEKYLKEFGLSFSDIAGCVPMGALLEDNINTEGVPKERIDRAFANDPYLKIFGNLEAFKDSWPMRHINNRMPPFLILIAESERFQPPILASSEKFAAEAKKAGAQVAFEILKDRTHMGTVNKMVTTDDSTLQRIVQFARQVKPK